MLIYLASYPRSGNTWVRDLISIKLGFLTSSVYREGHPASRDVPADYSAKDGPLFLEYRRKQDPENVHHALLNGAGPRIPSNIRRALAEDDDIYFLKTHELPSGKYGKGERVVHIVRHPGDVFVSYRRYLLAFEDHGEVRIRDVIQGKFHPGSWSHHSLRWMEEGKALGHDYLRIRYEDLSADIDKSFTTLRMWLGIESFNQDTEFPDFEYWHGINPDMYRSGTVGQWNEALSPSEQRLTRKIHGRAMRLLGYERPT